ncbi:MAG: hypothetical protein CSA20_00890 [Deltaproteobacteria bacterium]|nr:MAG: hypothetical protein CSA20_00890 [Deltaproteobacteria bacterium]
MSKEKHLQAGRHETKKVMIPVSRMSITARVALLILLVVLLPMSLTTISYEYGWLVPGQNVILAVPIFFLFILLPFSRLLAHNLINRDLISIGRFCSEVKSGNYSVYFDLPSQKEEEDPFLLLLRNLCWMSHNIEKRELDSRSRYDQVRGDYEQLEHKALTDPLTGLFNRHYLEQFTANTDAQQTFDQMSVIYIDCDRFKAVNDKYGHNTGDNLLIWLADCLKNACRQNHDIPVRMGGDEFLIFLPDADIKQAEGVAERTRTLFHRKHVYKTTLSIGIAHASREKSGIMQEPFSLAELIVQADTQAYTAKEAGGDEICANNLLRWQSRMKAATHGNIPLADFDGLTGLPNRYLAESWFQKTLAQTTRSGRKFCLMFLDLDDFKTINEELGHGIGDQYLKYLAGVLKNITGTPNSLFRLGGDEFLVMPADVQTRENVIAFTQQIIDEIQKPVIINNQTISATVSIGIARVPDHGTDFDELCKRADIALFQAKERGKGHFCLFTKDMGRRVSETMKLNTELRMALAHNELELYYQPQLDLQTGSIIGAEALVRWNHPERGLLLPDAFIHLAERSGQIVELGKWVIDRACKQCAAWGDLFDSPPTIAINISPLEIIRGSILKPLHEAMQRYGLQGDRIELEFTESLLLHKNSSVEQELALLHQAGITFAMDDFGTGYSNLSYLTHFAIDKIKIDKSFIFNMRSDKQNLAIVTAVIQMCKSLQIKTIAEGIENKETANLLHALGCNSGQGYYWAKPLTNKDFLAFCKENRLAREPDKKLKLCS